jgi:hypothetical protein
VVETRIVVQSPDIGVPVEGQYFDLAVFPFEHPDAGGLFSAGHLRESLGRIERTSGITVRGDEPARELFGHGELQGSDETQA